ncbi:tRNA (adenosine(37)-N6)-threonylcarbamoyltransferase complex dimerization subunit type 1 TsaB [bacterium]|nr:tRNA (adenosine(37)-N6)-threonylcarbamoyltransferase complex dimerization subunit type 1 TsaB [bacterium]
MKILVFDTCLDKMYVVLRTEDKILSSEVVENTDSKYHSAFLISTISKVLQENNVKPKDLNAIGINIGPGSFTGIRACTTVARVMAQQLNIKAIGVSSLEILSKLTPDNALVALDARKSKAYLWSDGKVQGAIELEKVQELASGGKYNVITDNRLQKILGGTSYQQNSYPLGEILSDLVLKKLETESGNWAELMPLYIQPPPMG